MIENYEFNVAFLKNDKDKLKNLLNEKDLLINKLLNQRSSISEVNLLESIDLQLNQLKNDVNEKKENNEILTTKINKFTEKFENSISFLKNLQNSLNPESANLKIFENCNDQKHHDFLKIQSIMDNELKDLRQKLEKLEKENKNIKKEKEQKENDLNQELVIKKKEMEALIIENEALGTHIEKILHEKCQILERQEANEEKYEKIIKAIEDENLINKEKCATLHKNMNLFHDHNHNKINKCEKEIELKIAEIHRLNDQINILSSKVNEERKNDENGNEGDVLENKNQEILNLKIDLNKLENALQLQNEETLNLKQKLTSQLNSFDSLIDTKEKEISDLKKGLRQAEFLLIEEKKKIQRMLQSNGSSSMFDEVLKGEMCQHEDLKTSQKEIEKTKQELAILKKSLKESMDMNDASSQELQKMKHKRNFFF